MRHRKETLFPFHLQGVILCTYVLLAISLFLLISCGGAAPSKPPILHPAPSPALFVLSSQGDIDAYRADGTSFWQASADTNSTSQPNLTGTHLINTGRTIIVAIDAVRAYSRTGELSWQHDLPYRTDDSLLVGSTLYIVGGGTATAWNILTRTLQWQQATVPGTSLTSDTHDLLVVVETRSPPSIFNRE